MRQYFSNLTAKKFMLLALPVLAAGYPVVMILIPAMVHAAVPDVVRRVLSLI